MADRPRVLFLHRQQTAVGYYRQWVPARALSRAGWPVTWREDRPWSRTWGRTPEERAAWVAEQAANHDVVVVDREIDPGRLGFLVGLRHRIPDGRMIVDFDDDFLQVPPWNPGRKHYNPGQKCYETGLWHLMWAELTTVTTRALADRFRSRCHAIRVVPNMIDPADWTGLPVDPERRNDPAFRIFYGGAGGHYGDMDVARPGLERFLENPPRPVRLVCFGSIPKWLHDLRRRHPGRVILCPWVPFEDYPAAVAWGGFDLAIAPLAEHPYNLAKSSIKFLEATVQGIPFLASRVGPYAELPSDVAVTIPNTPSAWHDTLRDLATDPALLEPLVRRARQFVLDTATVDHLASVWEDVIEDVRSRPKITGREDAEALPDERSPDPDAPGGDGPEPGAG